MISNELKNTITALTAEGTESFKMYLEQGYEQLEKNDSSRDAIVCWQKAWNQMKEILAGMEAKPEVEELDREADGKFCMDTWLFDVCRVMLQEEKYEELSAFAKEIMEQFSWTEESAKAFKQMAGQKED